MNDPELLKKLDEKFGDNFELQNQIRERIFQNLSRMNEQVGNKPGMEGLIDMVDQKFPGAGAVWREGIQRQKEIEEKLVPWLKQKNYAHSNPTTRGVIYVKGKHLTFSIMKKTETVYDVELYNGPMSGTQIYTHGYNPSKQFDLTDLKHELMKLYDAE